MEKRRWLEFTWEMRWGFRESCRSKSDRWVFSRRFPSSIARNREAIFRLVWRVSWTCSIRSYLTDCLSLVYEKFHEKTFQQLFNLYRNKLDQIWQSNLNNISCMSQLISHDPSANQDRSIIVDYLWSSVHLIIKTVHKYILVHTNSLWLFGRFDLKRQSRNGELNETIEMRLREIWSNFPSRNSCWSKWRIS